MNKMEYILVESITKPKNYYNYASLKILFYWKMTE